MILPLLSFTLTFEVVTFDGVSAASDGDVFPRPAAGMANVADAPLKKTRRLTILIFVSPWFGELGLKTKMLPDTGSLDIDGIQTLLASTFDRSKQKNWKMDFLAVSQCWA